MRRRGTGLRRIILLQRNHASLTFLLSAAVLLLLPTAALTQEDVVTSISMNNSFVGVTIYQSGADSSGRFSIWNVEGDPSSSMDDHESVVDWGSVRLMIDMLPEDEDTLGKVWATFEKGGSLGIWGDAGDGSWLLVPSLVPNQKAIRGIWQPVPAEGVLGPITFEQEVRLLHDMVRFKWTITNNDAVSHQVGVRIDGDIFVEPQNTGVLNQRNAVSIPGYPLVEERTLISSPQIPAYVDFYNGVSDPSRAARIVLEGNSAAKPDMLGIDEYSALSSSAWSYVADPLSTSLVPKFIWGYEIWPEHQYITNNLGYAAFWKPVTVAAGKSRTIIHYIGNPASNSSVNLPSIDRPVYAASVNGPVALKYYVDEITGEEVYGPETFRITASLENQDSATNLTNCGFTLILPSGLALDSSEPQATKSIPLIGANSESSVSWLVRATGAKTGLLTYYVSVNAYPMGGTILRRDINVPAISTRSLAYGWQQFSVPFLLTSTSPSSLGLMPGSMIKMFRYDTSLPRSAPYYPYEEVLSVTPGEAYWLKMAVPSQTDMTPGTYAPLQWQGGTGHMIPVRRGWNMIGNPYVYTVTMGELKFYAPAYGILTYDEAIVKRMISRTLYSWNTTFNTWNWSTLRSAPLAPWQGYWFKLLDDRVEAIVISPAAQIGASVGGSPPDDGGDDGGGPPPLP